MDEPQFKPTEDDVLVYMRYLRTNLPEYATPENVIKLVNHHHVYQKALEEMHPEEVEKVLKDLEDY